MSYNDFTLEDVKNLGYEIKRSKSLIQYDAISIPTEVMAFMQMIQETHFTIKSEIARRESEIFPLLIGFCFINKKKVRLHSGDAFDVDAKLGLKGQVDYAITGDINAAEITSPIIMITEAKKNNLEQDAPQCMAEMIAAKILNGKKNIKKPIYGIITTGDLWGILKLEENTITWGEEIYYVNEKEKIMGVMQSMLNNFLSEYTDRL